MIEIFRFVMHALRSAIYPYQELVSIFGWTPENAWVFTIFWQVTWIFFLVVCIISFKIDIQHEDYNKDCGG